jgi:hypothetical protein
MESGGAWAVELDALAAMTQSHTVCTDAFFSQAAWTYRRRYAAFESGAGCD